MRQGEAKAIASSSCNYYVLVSSVKSSLNTAPKCSILRSSNKKFYVERVYSPVPGGRGPPSRTHPLGAFGTSTNNASSALDLSTLGTCALIHPNYFFYFSNPTPNPNLTLILISRQIIRVN